MPGRSTLIATVRPSRVTPRWTCAIEAEPTGTGSISANTSPIGRSNARADLLLDLRERDRRQAVLQRQQVVRGFVADEVGPGGERLAELDRRRADRLEGGGVVGNARLDRAEAGEPGQPAHRGRRVGIALDPAQRPVARERAAPLEQAPDMRGGLRHP